jgi:hypothetical protein
MKLPNSPLRSGGGARSSRDGLRNAAVAFAFVALVGIFTAAPARAIAPEEWRYRQTLEIPTSGLVRVDLPPETLDAARPALEDLRVLDAAGNEVAFLIERPMPLPEASWRSTLFNHAINLDTTVISLATGTKSPLVGVTLETPAVEFIKAVRVEGSHGPLPWDMLADGRRMFPQSGDAEKWNVLAEGAMIFRQPHDAEKMRVSFPTGVWEFLRLTIDDRRSPPVPFSNALLHSPGAPARTEPASVTIESRDESAGVTRLALDLGAANLTLASVTIETPEPLFTREVTLAVPEIAENGIREQPIGKAVICRVSADGKTEARLDIPIEKQIRSRRLLLLIRNDDSPPIEVSAVRVERRLARAVFFAREPGRHSLLTGNSQCAAPRYDVSTLGVQVENATAARLQPSPLADNPGYKPPEALAALTLGGANIEVAGWRFRKPITLARHGAQQLELDLEVLAHASPDQRDLRLVRDGRQIPFVVERTSISRTISPVASAVAVPKKPTLSRWSIELPQPALPIARLVCVSSSPLFERHMRLWEEVTDERGEKLPRELGRAAWKQTPERAARELVIHLDETPLTDTLIIETDNGDNPSIELRDFRCTYPVTRLVFKAAPGDVQSLWLYYGNRDAVAPRYDVHLVSDELLRAEKSSASPGGEERLETGRQRLGDAATKHGNVIFWAALAIVVTALLLLVSRLLPKTE